MKKLLLVPSFFIATTIPLVSYVGCSKKSNWYTTTVKKHDNVNVEPQKFQLHKDLVIKYGVTGGYRLDLENSYINVGENTYNLLFDSDVITTTTSDVTIPAEKVNNKRVKISFSAIKITAALFETDPWDVVCKSAKNGIDGLCQAYCCEKQDFLGLKRKVYFDGLEYDARVVGVDHDTYGVNDTKTALTFEFVDLIFDQKGHHLFTFWNQDSESTNHDYWSSDLYKNLNSESDVTWYKSYETPSSFHDSVFTALCKENPELGPNIKIVNKNCVVCNETASTNAQWEIKPGTSAIFLPSIANIFSQTGIDNSSAAGVLTDEIKALYKQEGTQYEFYQLADNVGDGLIFNDNQPVAYDCLIKRYIDGGDHPYWITAPRIDDDKKLWAISPEGKAMGECYIDSLMPTAPCFCI